MKLDESLYALVPECVANSKKLAVKYSAGKPIRKITINDIGGIYRHAPGAEPRPTKPDNGPTILAQTLIILADGPMSLVDLCAKIGCRERALTAAIAGTKVISRSYARTRGHSVIYSLIGK